ncbi:MAG: sensory box protein [Rhizobacter sp.]|nr:sensory box protein [Rhizobacter sp.]
MNNEVSVLFIRGDETGSIRGLPELRELQLELVSATSRAQTLEALRHRDFALVLVDADGLDGKALELSELVHEQRRSRSTPVAFLTGTRQLGLRHEGRDTAEMESSSVRPALPEQLKSRLAFFTKHWRPKPTSRPLQDDRPSTSITTPITTGSEAFYQFMVDLSPQIAWTATPNGEISYLNAFWFDYTGAAAEEALRDGWACAVDPEHRKRVEAEWLRSVRTGEQFQCEIPFRRSKDGSYRWHLSRGVPVKDEAGAISRWLGYAVDIDDRRRRVEKQDRLVHELSLDNERLGELFQSAPAFMAVLGGPSHVFEMANAQYTRLVGRDDLLGKTVCAAMPEIVEQGFVGLLDHVFATGEMHTGIGVPINFSVENGPAATRFVDFVYQPIHGRDGAVSGILVHGVDVTAHHHAIAELTASEQRFTTVFESMHDGYCLIEMVYDERGNPCDHRFLKTNPMFETQTGFKDAVGKTIRELVPGISMAPTLHFEEVVRTGKSVKFTSDETRSMGRCFDVTATRAGGDGAKLLAVLFNDVTERMNGEAKLRRLAAELAEADVRKDEFIATLAHELRNPLAPLRTGLEVMRLSENDPEASQRAREMLERQLSQMVHLVNDLLDVSRINTGKFDLRREVTDLKTLVDSAVETSLPQIVAGQHALSVALPDERVMLQVDATRISQIFTTLLNNAAKYTPSGGEIGLSASVIERAQAPAGKVLEVAVTDNGIGIAPAALPRLFAMFSQAEAHESRTQGGLGIGLSLARRLVELHGGTVEAWSPGKGCGSTFTVRLPLDIDVRQSSPQPVDRRADAIGTPRPAAKSPLRVLVADDNRDAADSLAEVLRLKGYQARVAYDGEEAVQAAIEFDPGFVFLDIGMPKMNGYQVAAALRKMSSMADVPLVALTGWGTAADREKAHAAGFDHHLTKPPNLQAVLRLLEDGVPSRSKQMQPTTPADQATP